VGSLVDSVGGVESAPGSGEVVAPVGSVDGSSGSGLSVALLLADGLGDGVELSSRWLVRGLVSRTTEGSSGADPASPPFCWVGAWFACWFELTAGGRLGAAPIAPN